MPRFAHNDVLDNGPAYIRANCNAMVLIGGYTFGNNYAAVVAQILASVAMAPTDFALGTSDVNRTLTTAPGKADLSADANGGGSDNHIAFLDTVNSKVLWVTEETSQQAVTAGNPVYFPSLVYTTFQPQVP